MVVRSHRPLPDDVVHFDQHADHWWDKQGSFKVLHQVNPLRLTFMHKHDVFKGKRVLDIGCGGGILSEELARLEADVTAIDLSPRSIDIAKKHAEENQLSVDYRCSSLEDFGKDYHQYFDVICCMEMIEHVDNPVELVANMSTLLSDQGVLYVSTLNRNFLSWLLAVVMSEKVLGWIPKESHNAGKFLQPAELVAMARSAQLFFTHSVGIVWNPISQTFQLSDKRLEVNYICRFCRS